MCTKRHSQFFYKLISQYHNKQIYAGCKPGLSFESSRNSITVKHEHMVASRGDLFTSAGLFVDEGAGVYRLDDQTLPLFMFSALFA